MEKEKAMIIVQAPNGVPPEGFSKSIFLAGPTPRDAQTPDWRPQAIQLLEAAGYDGVVFNPNPGPRPDYDPQVEWERKMMGMSDVILFWVPRNLETMPAFTTNVEFGTWLTSGKVILAYPPNAEKMRYLQHMADVEKVPVFQSLNGAVAEAITRTRQGALRVGGEREVPLEIWNKEAFQTWMKAQRQAGNRLDGAKVVWVFRVGKNKERAFLWAVHVDVFIGSENRHKTNEVVITRPDISAVVAYCWPSSRISTGLDNIEVAIVREFRVPASVGDCFIREVPGGSSLKPGTDPLETVAHEMEEETGLTVPADRFQFIGARQVAGTLVSHHAHVYSVALTLDEMVELKRSRGEVHGVIEDTERTYVEVYTVADLLTKPLTDWANLGMIFAALPPDLFLA